MAQVFKIRRIKDGLFSTGGSNPSFSSRGKVWSNSSALTNHLLMVYGPGLEYNYNAWRRDPYAECEVVVMEIEEISISRLKVDEHLHQYRQKKNNKHAATLKRLEEEKVKNERAFKELTYENLRKELGKDS